MKHASRAYYGLVPDGMGGFTLYRDGEVLQTYPPGASVMGDIIRVPVLCNQPNGSSLHTVHTQRYSIWTAPVWGQSRLLGHVTVPLRGIYGNQYMRAHRAALRAALVLWEEADTVEMEF